MRGAGALAAVLLAAASCPARSDRDEVRRLMGRNDYLLIWEIQAAAAGDVDAGRIRRKLDEMIGNFRSIENRRPFAEPARNNKFPFYVRSALRDMERLNASWWTPENRGKNFEDLRKTCRNCHDRLVEQKGE